MKVTCTICRREVGVVSDWNRREGQQADEYRIVRHRATDKKNKNGRQEICPGTGVRIAVPV